jgi:hypothetical protein
MDEERKVLKEGQKESDEGNEREKKKKRKDRKTGRGS